MLKKFIPFAYAKSIFDVDYENLRKQGVTTLFFDLDNTIISYDEHIIEGERLKLLEALSKTFKVLIISNSKIKRVSNAVEHTGLPYVHFATKPLKRGFKKGLKKVQSKRSEVAVIGDQLMTDCFGANRMKFKAILVYPVVKKSDHKYTRFNRKLERFVIKKIMKKYPKLYEERLKAYVES